MIQWMLAIWFLVPLPFLKSAWTSGSSQFTYCWTVHGLCLSPHTFALPSPQQSASCSRKGKGNSGELGFRAVHELDESKGSWNGNALVCLKHDSVLPLSLALSPSPGSSLHVWELCMCETGGGREQPLQPQPPALSVSSNFTKQSGWGEQGKCRRTESGDSPPQFCSTGPLLFSRATSLT